MWKDYFSFNKRQRNGIMVLLVLIAGMMVYLIFADYIPPSPANIDFAAFKTDVAKAKFKVVSAKKPEQKTVDTGHSRAIELNTADSAELALLPDVTPKLARTIIRFRNALGGYYSKQQLHEVYGMDSVCYNAISRLVKVNATLVQKININMATKKDMMHHPYIRRKLAKAIYKYRKKEGPFKTIGDVKNVNGIDEETYNKLKPYLSL